MNKEPTIKYGFIALAMFWIVGLILFIICNVLSGEHLFRGPISLWFLVYGITMLGCSVVIGIFFPLQLGIISAKCAIAVIIISALIVPDYDKMFPSYSPDIMGQHPQAEWLIVIKYYEDISLPSTTQFQFTGNTDCVNTHMNVLSNKWNKEHPSYPVAEIQKILCWIPKEQAQKYNSKLYERL